MLDAIRFKLHLEKTYQERLKRGEYPYRPLPPVPVLDKPPTFGYKELADGDRIGAFIQAALEEGDILSAYASAVSQEYEWYLHHIMQATRFPSLLTSFQWIESHHALIFPALGLAISPPSYWRIVNLEGTRVFISSTASTEHAFKDPIPACLPGDPIGVLKSTGKAVLTMTLPEETSFRLVFVPCYPVPDAELEIGGNRYLPMKTRRGLYFWVGKTSTRHVHLHIQEHPGTILLGCPLLGDGEWDQSGEILLTVPGVSPPFAVDGAFSGASLLVKTQTWNIQWIEVNPGEMVMPDVMEIRQVATPSPDGTVTIPAGYVPRRVYCGYRSWYVERWTDPSSRTAAYLPLEATRLTVANGETVRLTAYFHLPAPEGKTITASVPGTVTVNGIVQSNDRIHIPPGESEVNIILSDSGSYHFYLPVPGDVHMRARYVSLPFTLKGTTLTIPKALQIPHEIVLVPYTPETVTIRVTLPVSQGRPAAVADLQIRQ